MAQNPFKNAELKTLVLRWKHTGKESISWGRGVGSSRAMGKRSGFRVQGMIGQG